MIISSLIKKGPDVAVYLDDGTHLLIDYRTVLDSGIRKNDNVDSIFLDDLKKRSSLLKIRDSALRILARRQHSVHELKIKLLKREFLPDAVYQILEELKSKEYLDDDKFSRMYADERLSKRKIGVNRLKAELFKKGIEKTIVERVVASVDQTELSSNALILARRKSEFLKSKGVDNRKMKEKLFMFLSSKGYDSESIMKVISEITVDED